MSLPDTPCLLGPVYNGVPYARATRLGKSVYLHRWAWEQRYGLIPKGKEIHHLCGEKACINVEHMELLTHSAHAQIHWRQERCRNDAHDMTIENTVYAEGKRLCLACYKANRERQGRSVPQRLIDACGGDKEQASRIHDVTDPQRETAPPR